MIKMRNGYSGAVEAQKFRGTEEQCNARGEENTFIIWTVLFIQSRVLIQVLLITEQLSIPAGKLFCIPLGISKNSAIFYIYWGQENLFVTCSPVAIPNF